MYFFHHRYVRVYILKLVYACIYNTRTIFFFFNIIEEHHHGEYIPYNNGAVPSSVVPPASASSKVAGTAHTMYRAAHILIRPEWVPMNDVVVFSLSEKYWRMYIYNTHTHLLQYTTPVQCIG